MTDSIKRMLKKRNKYTPASLNIDTYAYKKEQKRTEDMPRLALPWSALLYSAC